MNEIQQYCLHVTENEAEKESIQYFIHNTETLYDISYYSNMIDIHVEDECNVSINTFQLNALLQLLDRLLDESTSAADAAVPTQRAQSPPSAAAAQTSQPSQPVTNKFNINSVSLSLNNFCFTYFMPGSYVPSYQRPDTSIPYSGEDKEHAKPSGQSTQSAQSAQSAQSTQYLQPSQYAIPLRFGADVTRRKSLLKPFVEFRMHSVEVVCNTYDNQFYTADVMCAVRQVSFFPHCYA